MDEEVLEGRRKSPVEGSKANTSPVAPPAVYNALSVAVTYPDRDWIGAELRNLKVLGSGTEYAVIDGGSDHAVA